MTQRIVALLAAVLAVGVGLAAAQASPPQNAAKASGSRMSATGVVTSVSDGSFVIESGGKQSLTFSVDKATRVLKPGASTKTREKKAAGAPGVVVADLVHAGDRVTVRYERAGEAFKATEVRVASR
jgi:hypothetical protein